jgi:hypothetical protein
VLVDSVSDLAKCAPRGSAEVLTRMDMNRSLLDEVFRATTQIGADRGKAGPGSGGQSKSLNCSNLHPKKLQEILKESRQPIVSGGKAVLYTLASPNGGGRFKRASSRGS